MSMPDEDSDHVRQEDLAAYGSDESNDQRFKRIATRRVRAALDQIRLIGNCSNKASYAYTPEQIDKIETSLRVAVEETMGKFRGSAKDKPAFEL